MPSAHLTALQRRAAVLLVVGSIAATILAIQAYHFWMEAMPIVDLRL